MPNDPLNGPSSWVIFHQTPAKLKPFDGFVVV
jgi:hypothetical protein